MRKMKDSGIEWIGEIPEEWEVKKLSFLYDNIGSGTTPPTSNSFYYEGDINWVNTGDLNDGYLYESQKSITREALEKFSTLKEYDENSIIIAMYGATIGKVAISKIKFTANQACCVLSQAAKCDSKYVYYWLLQNKENLISLSYGGGQPNISQETIKSLKIQLPSTVEEQSRIAEYLDKRCTEIDTVINAKEITKEKLKEYRQSIIYEDVTKGLAKNVPMKDSGIEWIGEIPEEWDIEKLKYHADFNPTVDTSKFNDEDEVSFVPMENLKNGYHITSTAEFSNVKKGYVQFINGDILIAKVTPCFENGNLAIANNLISGIGFGSTEINVIRCKSIETKYLFYYFQNRKFIERATHDMYGVAGLKRLIPSFIPESYYPIPTIIDQHQIADYLDNRCAEIDSVISANKITIDKLKEYRQSVIYEAVTGKTEI